MLMPQGLVVMQGSERGNMYSTNTQTLVWSVYLAIGWQAKTSNATKDINVTKDMQAFVGTRQSFSPQAVH